MTFRVRRGTSHPSECAVAVRLRALAARRIAAAERSMSASVVDQFDTETRIAATPCQRVPPTQHVPSSCTRPITSSVTASFAPNRSSTWFKHHLVQHLDAVGSLHQPPTAEPAHSTARPAPPPRHAPATAAPRRPRTRAPPRRLRDPVGVRAVGVAGAHEVGRGHPHRRGVGVAVADRDDAAVVGDVEPLVAVGRPRVGSRPRPRSRLASAGLAAAHSPNAPSTWTHAPCSCAAAAISASGSIAPVLTLPACAHTIAGPSPARSASASASARIAPCPSTGDDLDRRAPEPQQPQRPPQRHVRLLAGEHADAAARRRSPAPRRPSPRARAARAAPPPARSRWPSARRSSARRRTPAAARAAPAAIRTRPPRRPRRPARRRR